MWFRAIATLSFLTLPACGGAGVSQVTYDCKNAPPAMCQAFEQALLDAGAVSVRQNAEAPDLTLVVVDRSDTVLRLRIDQSDATEPGEEVMHVVSDRVFGPDMYPRIVADALRINSISF